MVVPTAIAVLGRNTIVKTEIAFIEELSRMLASASLLESKPIDRWT